MPFFLLAFASCNSGGGKSTTSAISNSAGIEGVWESCLNYEADSLSEKNIYLITDKVIQQVTTTYSGSNCIKGNEEYNYRYIMSYFLSGSNIHLSMESVTSTSLDPSDVSYSNTNNYCGYNNWVLNIPKNVSGRNCGGVTNSIGGSSTLSYEKSASRLSFISNESTIQMTLSSAFDFSQRGQTITDGNYVYFDGETGIYVSLDTGVYTVVYFDVATQRTYAEGGSFTSSNNILDFEVVGYVPSYCGNNIGERFQLPFSSTSFSLALKYPNFSILAEKVSMSISEFSTAYTGKSFTPGCF